MAQATRDKGPGTPVRDADAPTLADNVAIATDAEGAWTYVSRVQNAKVELTATTDATGQVPIRIEGALDSSGTGKVVIGAFGPLVVNTAGQVLELRLANVFLPYWRWSAGTEVGAVTAVTIKVHTEFDAMSDDDTAGTADAS